MRIGCQPVDAIAVCASSPRTYSTKGSAAFDSEASTTPIGLYIEIAPDSGQTMTTGEPSSTAARAVRSSVIPATYRPSATPATTSPGERT